jgi:putative ABC transport system permease protein
MNDLMICAHRELTRHKSRTLANVLGYTLAIGFTVLMVNLLVYAKAGESFLLDGTGTGFIIYLPACGEMTTLTPPEIASLALGIKPVRCENMCKVCNSCFKKPLDMRNEGFIAQNIGSKVLPVVFADEMKKYAQFVRDASPVILFRLRDPEAGYHFTLGGFDAANTGVVAGSLVKKEQVVAGRFLTPADDRAVIVDKLFAASRNLRVGSQLFLAQQPFEVVGVVDTGIRPVKADIYAAFKTAEIVVNRRLRSPLVDEMNILLVEAVKPEAVEAAVDAAKEVMQTGVVSTYACYIPASEVLGLNERSIVLLSLLLAGGAMLLSMKSQLAAVLERRRDIGVLKALGWTDANITRQIFYESLFQAGIGGILGCLVAGATILLAPVKTLLGITARIDPFLTPKAYLFGLFLAMLSGILAGWWPARRAARENPAEALRHGS